MNDNNFSLSRILVNEETQTSASPYIDPQLFNFNSDKTKLDIENSLYQFKYSIEEVARLVSAVQGNDLSIRNKGRIISPRSKRFNKLLDSLQRQIQLNSRYLHTYKEQKILVERLTRSLAYAIDPASRYSRNHPNSQRRPLFSHQKYEHSMKLGRASLFFDDPQQFGEENKDYDIVFSYQNSLCLMNDSYIFIFDKVSPNSLSAGKEFPITYKKHSFGSIVLYDYDQNEGDKEGSEDSNDPFAHHRVIMPIIDDDRTVYLVHSLGGSDSGSGQEINLKTLVTPYDFSFIDIILSIPHLSATEARDFLIFLYRESYLSAYVRSKLCQFLYENREPDKELESETISMRKSSNGRSTRVKVNLKTDLVADSLKIREWPELLGRFITLLDHSWFIEAAHRMERLELPQVIKSIAKNSDSQSHSNSRAGNKNEANSSSDSITPINSLAQYLLGIILWEFQGLDRGDPSEFLWEFLCKSVFSNLYLNKNDESSVKKRRKLEALFLGTKGKPSTSKTRIITQKAVERIDKMVRSRTLDDIFPKGSTPTSPKSRSKSNSPKSPVESFNPHKFLLALIQKHRNQIITILKNIPRTTEDASPLFYPIALEIRDALFKKMDESVRPRSSRRKRVVEEDNEDDDDEDETDSEVKISKSKTRSQSLQHTNKSSRKQSNSNSKRQNRNNEVDDVDDNRRRKNSHRAASASQSSQSSSAPKSRVLTDQRPSPLPLRKMGIPTGKKGSPKKKQQKYHSDEYEIEEDEDENYDIFMEEEEEEYESEINNNNKSRNRMNKSQKSPTGCKRK